MRAYVRPRAGLSRAMDRVAQALAAHAPVEVTDVEAHADLVVLHAIGHRETEEAVSRLAARGQKYAVVQYCLRSASDGPSALDWLALWAGAEAVWGYYDLARMAREDISREADDEAREAAAALLGRCKLYHAPLGVDAATFRPTGDGRRPYTILTSGYVMETEGVLEANAAVRAVGGKQYHLGPGDPRFGPEVTQALGISDEQLAIAYGRSRFVAGLRRCEGFELPAAEGLLCGARPICFDRPHYREWFGPWAVFVPEADEATVATAIEEAFRLEALPPVTPEERAAAAALFDWARVARGFWDRVLAPVKVEVVQRRRLLWVGDAAVATGFARATHHTLDVLRETWDVAVLGLNYQGDPHGYPYDIYPCRMAGGGGDYFGVERLPRLARDLQPDLIVLQNDPWNIPAYTKTLKDAGVDTPVAGAIAVDGKNCRGYALRDLCLAVFWTRFGEQEARRGGYDGPSAVVPLGVDLDLFRPRDKAAAREALLGTVLRDRLSPEQLRRVFIVGNVNRNQPRKRLDLTVAYFCEWVTSRQVEDAWLYLHIAPTGEHAYDVRQLMRYYGVKGRLILGEPEIGQGDPDDLVASVYAALDVLLTTTLGEGMGLTTLEAMACGVAAVAPDWAALGDWARDAAHLVPCTSTYVNPNQVNVVGGVPDRVATVEALDRLYRDRDYRASLGARGLALARRPENRWRAVGEAFRDALAAPAAVQPAQEAVA